MKLVKQVIIAIFIFSAFVGFFSCKRITQSDKPLYDVMTSHVWFNSKEQRYYQFLDDSICYYNYNELDTTFFHKFSIKWWIEYTHNTTYFHVKEIYDSVHYNEVKYNVQKYNDFKLKTYYKYVLKPNEFWTDIDSMKVIFKAVD